MRLRPKWQPEGDVDVASFQQRKPQATSSGDRYVSISGSWVFSAMLRKISMTNQFDDVISGGI
jgi:hypothetical protein